VRRVGGLWRVFERKFRAHDYQLGRRNCQRFLEKHFVLPLDNPIIARGLETAGAKKAEEARTGGILEEPVLR
jgi:hypothetical protein